MTKQLHVIYVPGLGDKKVDGQLRAVKAWRLWGVQPELFQMNWGDKKPWLPKFQRLLARIDELSAQDKPVALVGVSAGASAVINAYAARKNKIAGVVCVAGKINRPEAIDQRYYVNNISFVTSAYDCEQALKTLAAGDRARILSRFAVLDERVTRADSRVPGAHNRLSPTIGHVPTIAIQLIFGAPSFLHFLKRQTKSLPIKA